MEIKFRILKWKLKIIQNQFPFYCKLSKNEIYFDLHFVSGEKIVNEFVINTDYCEIDVKHNSFEISLLCKKDGIEIMKIIYESEKLKIEY